MSVWETLTELERHQPTIATARIHKIATISLWSSPGSEYIEAHLDAEDVPTEAWLYDAAGKAAPIGPGKVWDWLESVIEEAASEQNRPHE